jgi:putative membrane protein
MNTTIPSTNQSATNPTMKWTIGILSVVVPLLVAVLLSLNTESKINFGFDTRFIPHINAIFNSITSLCLIAGFFAIKSKNIKLHRGLMMTAFTLSSLFLVLYVIYHASMPSTKFGQEGLIYGVYLFILITHISLSIIVVPLVLWAIYFAWTGRIASHKKMVKWTFPVWTYVAITGVIVYFMISPYYQPL